MRLIGLVGSFLLSCTVAASGEQMNVLSPQTVPPNVIASALPACTAGNIGVVYRVTDSLLPALGVIVAGGGAVAVLVRCNGTSFLVGE